MRARGKAASAQIRARQICADSLRLLLRGGSPIAANRSAVERHANFAMEFGGGGSRPEHGHDEAANENYAGNDRPAFLCSGHTLSEKEIAHFAEFGVAGFHQLVRAHFAEIVERADQTILQQPGGLVVILMSAAGRFRNHIVN